MKLYKAFKVPRSAQSFMDKTFSLIEEGKVHKIAASFCFGREDVIPEMFQGFLLDMEISEGEAPTFFYYLKRHIEVDGDSHGLLALKMIEVLCGNDSQKWKEVQATAVESIQARETFWNDILRELNS